MHFLIKDDDLLEKYETISDKVSTDTKKELDSEPIYEIFENQNKISLR